MARSRPERGGPLTPEQARRAQRAIRTAVLVALAHTWLIVIVAALFAPDAVIVILVLALAYTLGMPFLLRHLRRDIDRRTTDASSAEGAFGRAH
jgi:fatty acid desaturase